MPHQACEVAILTTGQQAIPFSFILFERTNLGCVWLKVGPLGEQDEIGMEVRSFKRRGIIKTIRLAKFQAKATKKT